MTHIADSEPDVLPQVSGNRKQPRLAGNHLEALAASGIPPEFAALRGYRTVRESESELLQRLHFSDIAAGCVPGLAIPLLDAQGKKWGVQYRPDEPYSLNGKAPKYVTPVGQRNGLDVPPGVGDSLVEPGVWLWVTEGTKKADCAAVHGLCAVALSGVWNWRYTNKSGGKVALGDWDSIALNGRVVVISFDSDIRTNRHVRYAATRLANFLESRGAHVKYLHLPDGDWWDEQSKTGLDDFLVAGNTAQDLMWLVKNAPPESFDDCENDDPTQPTEADIEREIKRLNTTEEAKRRRRLEAWEEPPDQGDLATQLETVDPEVVYLIEDLCPINTINQLNAQFKIGKTTVVMNLVQALASGEPFLRRYRVDPKFAGSIAHWNLEVSRNTLLGWYAKQPMPLEARKRCFPLSVRGNLSLDFNNDVVVEWTVKWLQNNNIKVWIIDPLSKLFRDDENNNPAFNQWWLKLEHIVKEAEVQVVVLVHHTGHANLRARGASAMMGNPDVLLNYSHNGELGEKPPDSIRFLEAFGRDVDVPPIEIDFEPATNTLFATNSGKSRAEAKVDQRARTAGGGVWNANGRLKTGDLYGVLGWKQTGNSYNTNKAAIQRAVELNYIAQDKEGATVWNSPGSVDPRMLSISAIGHVDAKAINRPLHRTTKHTVEKPKRTTTDKSAARRKHELARKDLAQADLELKELEKGGCGDN